MNKMVVTNLRISEDRYSIVKAAAFEMGISINEYVNKSLASFSISSQFGKPKKKQKKTMYQALRELSSKKYKYKPMGLSKEDEIIYG